MKIVIDLDLESKKINNVDLDGLNPITASSVLSGVTAGLLAGVKVEVKNKNKIAQVKSNLIVPKGV